LAANVSVFAIMYCMQYKPLPYPDAHRLVNVRSHMIKEGWDTALSSEQLRAFGKLPDVFDQFGGYSYSLGWLQNGPGADPTRLNLVFMEPVVFDLLGLRPLAGRLPTADDVGVQGPGRVWVSGPYAVEHFGSAERALGAILALRSGSYQIAGVLRPNALFSTTHLWLPVRYSPEALAANEDLRYSGYGHVNGVGRLAAGVGRDQAGRQLTELLKLLPEVRDDPQIGNIRITAASLRTLFGDAPQYNLSLRLLLATALVVMLITTCNVCNLYLARLAARRHESALLAALGAGIGRQVRLHFMDAAILCGGGLALGLALAPAGLILLGHFGLLPEISPYPIGVDLVTFLFALLVMLPILGALLGSAVWIQRRSGSIQDVLKEAGNRQSGGRGLRRVRVGLTVGQVALTLTLLVGAGLLMRSAGNVLSEDLGFDRNQLVVTGVNLDTERSSFDQMMQRLAQRVLQLPGVRSATLAECVPVVSRGDQGNYQSVNGAPDTVSHWPEMTYCPETDFNYFALLGVPLIAGRPFTPEEARSRAPVAIVDRAFVRRNFPEGEALGRTIRISVTPDPVVYPEAKGPIQRDVTIIGVANTVGSYEAFLNIDKPPTVYAPGQAGATIIIRSTIEVASLQRSLKSALREVSPRAILGETELVQTGFSSFVHNRYPLNDLLKVLCIATLILVSVGLYAVLAYSVRMRMREFGVRLALGESAARLRRDVVFQGLRWAGIGAVIAVMPVWILSRVLASQLYGVSPLDPLTLVTVLFVVAIVTVVASWWPARLASRVDPLSVLRAE